MFALIFFSTYLPLLLYTYFRLERLLTKKKNKNIFSLLFVFLTALFPLGSLIARSLDDPSSDRLFTLAFNSLPYLFYLFLLVTLFDLFRLFFYFSSRRLYGILVNYARTFFPLFFLLPALIVSYGIFRYGSLQVHSYSVEMPKKNSSLDSLKVLLVADFHLASKRDLPFLENFVAQANQLRPDIILLGGDVFEMTRGELPFSQYEEILSKLQSRYGVYAIFGNHETYGDPLDRGIYKRAGIRLLEDEVVILPQGVALLGRKEARLPERKELKDFHFPPSLPLFVMDHKPADYTKAQSVGVSALFSGHTHHAQIFPLQLVTEALYDLSWGHKKLGETDFFVTSGIRGWGPKVRTSGDAELMLIDFRFR